MSELHLDVIQHRLKNRYKLDINTHVPHVPYLETVAGEAKAHHHHKKQTGGRGQFAECHSGAFVLGLGARGLQFRGVHQRRGDSQSVHSGGGKGLKEQIEKGVISGDPVVDIEVELFFGGYTLWIALSKRSRPRAIGPAEGVCRRPPASFWSRSSTWK